jgi:2,3-dihydroxy-p-cumate/2,3-dihydroxybenzoate 3,4-dioxygenase
MSDIFGLQRVADQDGEIAFRSDDRSRMVSLKNPAVSTAKHGQRAAISTRVAVLIPT